MLPSGNETANICVKNCSVYRNTPYNGDIVDRDIKHGSSDYV